MSRPKNRIEAYRETTAMKRHTSPRPARPSPTNLTRRHFLQGLGICVALPAFESLVSSPLRAAEVITGITTDSSAAPLATTATGAPLRMAFVYFPNGARQDYWWPKVTENDIEFGRTDLASGCTDFQLGRTMQPLEKLRQHLQVLGGLDHANATPGPDGAGDHARANGTFLTGVRVRKTAGADIHAGVSIDQVAAQHVGQLTRFPSLELSCEPARKSGNCDSGYSCAYQYNLAWRSPSTPLAPEANPRLVFERLFGSGPLGKRRENYEIRQQQQRSILDFVLDDARALQRNLNGRDQEKLDDYLTSVRDIEQRIERAEQFGPPPEPAVDTPASIPASYEEHLRLMYSMMALAFQTDSTRVATMLLAHDGSNRPFPELNISAGHHDLSHHRGNEEMLAKIGDIDRWYMKQFAWFLDKLDQTHDVDGNSLLHNSMIVYGCGNSDGNRHTHVNLPIVLAGDGGGTLSPGRYVKFNSVPACNLFLSMLDRMGIQNVPRFGDSTAKAQGI
jgi:Protein of unknown function (DUF1552)